MTGTKTKKTGDSGAAPTEPVRSAPRPPAAAARSAHISGTQSIHRAVSILREVSTNGRGLRLVDIAGAMGLERPTAHRIVKSLVAQGMLAQDPATKCYRLGHVVYELGLAASPHFDLKEVCQPTLLKIAGRIHDSVYLIVRSGFDIVCIDMIEGSFPIRARTMEVGTRWPLGIGAASVALILPLGADETERILEVNEPRLQQYGLIGATQLRGVIEKSRSAGYSINDEIVLPGICAVGAPIPNRGAAPYAAISVAGISARFRDERREEIGRLLLKETRLLARKLGEGSSNWS